MLVFISTNTLTHFYRYEIYIVSEGGFYLWYTFSYKLKQSMKIENSLADDLEYYQVRFIG